jgi:hypothetical protein
VGTYNSFPNFNAWLDQAWGSGLEFWASCGFPSASGLLFGVNPPYYLDDFLASYPKFFGPATQYTGTTTVGAATVTGMPSTVGLSVGQFLQSGAFPPGTTIKSVDNATQVTLSQNATTAGATALTVYTQSPIPAFMLQQYVNLASASLVADQWQEQWYIAMGWFIAHYATLYARSDAAELISSVSALLHGEVPAGTTPGTTFTLSAAPSNGVLEGLFKNRLFQVPGVDYTLAGAVITTTVAVQPSDSLYATWQEQSTTTQPSVYTPAQIAAKGISIGMQVSKSVGDVSVSYQPLAALEDWAAWNLTTYGQQLATMAKVMGSGPLVIW